MLKRSIEIDDPFALSVEEKVFRHAKRLCVVFAGTALTLGALDLMNVRMVENAAEFLHNNPLRVADMPRLIRVGIGDMAFASTEPYATAAIPDADIKLVARPMPVPARVAAKPDPKTDSKPVNSSITELAAARHQDAVELAMVAPALVPQLQHAILRSAPETAPQPAEDSGAVKLASLGPAMMAPVFPAAPPIVLPAMIKVLPPPAPGVPPASPAQRLNLEGKDRAKAEQCLSKAIYFEARDQPYRGQVAVAQVVINRVFSPFYPNDVCGVIYQNAHRHLSCQFTFACDGKSKAIRERGAWARARRIAKNTLDGQLYVPAVGVATHYHAIYVHPYWTREMKKLVREGIHNFYRPIAWGNGSDAPIWSRKALAEKKK